MSTNWRIGETYLSVKGTLDKAVISILKINIEEFKMFDYDDNSFGQEVEYISTKPRTNWHRKTALASKCIIILPRHLVFSALPTEKKDNFFGYFAIDFVLFLFFHFGLLFYAIKRLKIIHFSLLTFHFFISNDRNLLLSIKKSR